MERRARGRPRGRGRGLNQPPPVHVAPSLSLHESEGESVHGGENPPVPPVQPARGVNPPPVNVPGGNVPAANPAPLISLFEFRRMNPLEFSGSTDPMQAQAWLFAMEKYFGNFRIMDPYTVQYASFLLQGDADIWWKAVQPSLGDMATWTWEAFKEKFHEAYFPLATRERLLDEFIHLTQGDMSVADYQAKFFRLSQFAYDNNVPESQKARKFEKGLRDSIRSKVVPLRLPTYATVVDRALVVEADDEERRKNWEKRKKARGESSSQFGGSDKKGKSIDHRPRYGTRQQSAQESRGRSVGRGSGSYQPSQRQNPFVPNVPSFQPSQRPPRPPMSQLGTQGQLINHPDSRTCFYCGVQGHVIRDCPYIPMKPPLSQVPATSQVSAPTMQNIPRPEAPVSSSRATPSSGRGRGKYFAMTQQDVVASNAVVTGNNIEDTSRIDE